MITQSKSVISTRRVLRFEIPVDDKPHSIPAGPVLKVAPWRAAMQTPAGRLEVWVEAATPDDWPRALTTGTPRTVQVFGTGHPIPAGATWLGSCLDGPLVWHLYNVTNAKEVSK